MIHYAVAPGVLGRNGESVLADLNQRSALGQKYMIGDKNGWMQVKLEPERKEVSLPEYLQVDHIETKRDLLSSELRDHFVILEGVEKGKRASVKRERGQSYLG